MLHITSSVILTLQIIGDPSEKIMKDMAEEEKNRIAEQVKLLGESGLEIKAQELEDATDENEAIVYIMNSFFFIPYNLFTQFIPGSRNLLFRSSEYFFIVLMALTMVCDDYEKEI